MHKSIEYLLYFTGYTLLLLWFGKSGIKKTRNLRDFFLAGNGLGLWASVFTFTATWFSAASMQGLTGSLFAFGLSSVWYAVIPWYIGTIFLYFLVPKIRKYNILSLPEYFRIRYQSLALQRLGGMVIVFAFILYMTIQIRGFGVVMSELLDIHYTLATLLVFLFIVYTTFGGLFSVSRTDGLNFFLIVLGVLFSAGMVLGATGGFDQILEKAAQIATAPFTSSAQSVPGSLLKSFSAEAYPPLMVITGFVGWGLGLAANPQYLIRILAAKDEKTAYGMITYSLLILTLIYFCLVIIGLGARVLQPSISSINTVDEVFPYIINNILYSKLSGFILISMAAAAVSTANSQFLILASGFTYDLFGLTAESKIKEDRLITYNRVFILIAGTVSLVLSINPPVSLLTYGGYVYGLFAVTFLLPLYGGLFWKRANRLAATASAYGGLLTMTVFAIMDQGRYGTPGHLIHPAFPGILVALVLFVSIGFASKEGTKREA
jgi:SSS family solute:Na+ symporter